MKLDIRSLLSAYRDGSTTPEKVITELKKKIAEAPASIWISHTSDESLSRYLKNLHLKSPRDLPLYGIPFAIKDNIDLENCETTAGCPAFAYTPNRSATVVGKLIRAGAIPLGKTNMDQFATGLVGVRTPYGAIPNRFAPEYISGGSSSGSAAALAYGLCSFSLGTDTAGSGRVPAAFNNLYGVKPTCGLLSTKGVVPACRSLDCVSLFALNLSDAKRLLEIAKGYDEDDDYSRKAPENLAHLPGNWTFGVPEESELNFFGNENYRKLFEDSITAAEKAGGKMRRIHFKPFLEAARLLYEGPWVFERYSAVGKFIEEHSAQIHPVTRKIIIPPSTPHPSQIFDAFHKLRHAKALADREMDQVDFLMTPTVGTCYKTAEVEADPIRLNSNLGYYTNYMNLLDFSALAIPVGFAGKLPFGVTLVGKAFAENVLFSAAEKLRPFLAPKMAIAVCGAHLQGMPLHGELEDAEFLGTQKTAAEYTMFALPGNIPKPALVRAEKGGSSFHVELYALSAEEFGKFISQIPAPLSIGKIRLENGTEVSGFLGEPIVQKIGKNISEFGDWRKYFLSL